MDHDPDWQRLVSRLKAAKTVKVVQYEVGDPITKDDREILKVMEAVPPPPPVMRLLEKANGLKLLWNGSPGGHAVQGSINILPLVQSALRAGATEESAPLEGVLWNDEYAPAIKKQLQEMAIFEALAGRSAHLTYRVGDKDARLFLVDDDRIEALVPDFVTVIGLIERFGGADGLREHLVHADWKDRLAKDETLQAIAAL
ncbi:hypothetical protein GCM10009087_47430 [Sphingomonas oligophenolica]|uniref:Uncharacterized protein n=1 Tax=Sphingomonas oligophenolica TaxID=301154 RepID=A0ABU9Y7A2_9SPHN